MSSVLVDIDLFICMHLLVIVFFFFKQKTAYELRISDWSSDVCSSDLPGYQRLSPVYLGDYVTLDAGTGVVHSSPAYGVEDFISCKAHGLGDEQIVNPVMGDGHYSTNLPLFGGLMIWKANPKIVETLDASGELLKVEQHTPKTKKR